MHLAQDSPGPEPRKGLQALQRKHLELARQKFWCFCGLRFRVWDAGFRVLGLRVSGLGFD